MVHDLWRPSAPQKRESNTTPPSKNRVLLLVFEGSSKRKKDAGEEGIRSGDDANTTLVGVTRSLASLYGVTFNLILTIDRKF